MPTVFRLPTVLLTAAMLSNIAAVVHAVEGQEKDMDACVILLHGMGRTHRSMAKMAQTLAGEGYRVVNLDYPSTEASIETLSDTIVAETVQPADWQTTLGAGSFRYAFVGRNSGPALPANPSPAAGKPGGDAQSAQPGQRNRRSAQR
jgi:hypothetical protein